MFLIINTRIALPFEGVETILPKLQTLYKEHSLLHYERSTKLRTFYKVPSLQSYDRSAKGTTTHYNLNTQNNLTLATIFYKMHYLLNYDRFTKCAIY